MNGASIYGRTSGQTFCEGTKVWPFGIKALNVSEELGEWAMWMSQGPGCCELQQGQTSDRALCITIPLQLNLMRAKCLFFFLCSIMCLNLEPNRKVLLFFASSSHLYYWNCIHLADNQRNVYIPTEETRRNLNYAAPVISL